MSECTESPVSWTVRYTTVDGFDAMLTLRGDDLQKVMSLARSTTAGMSKAGCKPNGHTAAAIGGNGKAAPMCPTHGKPMKQSQHGGWYCPVKVAEDGGDGKPVYCKQKVKGG